MCLSASASDSVVPANLLLHSPFLPFLTLHPAHTQPPVTPSPCCSTLSFLCLAAVQGPVVYQGIGLAANPASDMVRFSDARRPESCALCSCRSILIALACQPYPTCSAFGVISGPPCRCAGPPHFVSVPRGIHCQPGLGTDQVPCSGIVGHSRGGHAGAQQRPRPHLWLPCALQRQVSDCHGPPEPLPCASVTRPLGSPCSPCCACGGLNMSCHLPCNLSCNMCENLSHACSQAVTDARFIQQGSLKSGGISSEAPLPLSVPVSAAQVLPPLSGSGGRRIRPCGHLRLDPDVSQRAVCG